MVWWVGGELGRRYFDAFGRMSYVSDYSPLLDLVTCHKDPVPLLEGVGRDTLKLVRIDHV
jgi:hypothetical protein